MKMRKFCKIVKAIVLVFGLVWLLGDVSEVRAEEYVIREASGDLEKLAAYEIPEEQAEQWIEEGKTWNQQSPQSAVRYPFLEYGSDYGYQDMTNREHGEQRQALYRELAEACRDFTTNGIDAEDYVVQGSGNQYSIAFIINTREMGLTDLTGSEKAEVYFMFRHDNPQYFWLSNSVLYSQSTLNVVTYDEYADGDIRKATLDEIVNTAETVYQSQISDADDMYNKVLKIHDTLIGDIEYSEDVNIPIAHSIAGAMTSGRSAVCEGYAKVMQVMMNCYGIENIYVTGLGNGGGHAWNMVGMDDGKYYWLDATWDDQPYEQFQHDYFLVGNNNFTDHIADSPEGTGANFLYALPEASDENYVYPPNTGDEEIYEKGDVNGDSNINLVDLMLCLNHVGGKELLEERGFAAADLNVDGNVDLVDLMRLLNYVGGKSDLL